MHFLYALYSILQPEFISSHTKIKRREVRIDTDIQIKNKTLTEYKRGLVD